MADPEGDADTLSEITYQDEIKMTKKSLLKKKKKKPGLFLSGCVLFDWEREGFELSPKAMRSWVG